MRQFGPRIKRHRGILAYLEAILEPCWVTQPCTTITVLLVASGASWEANLGFLGSILDHYCITQPTSIMRLALLVGLRACQGTGFGNILPIFQPQPIFSHTAFINKKQNKNTLRTYLFHIQFGLLLGETEMYILVILNSRFLSFRNGFTEN